MNDEDCIVWLDTHTDNEGFVILGTKEQSMIYQVASDGSCKLWQVLEMAGMNGGFIRRRMGRAPLFYILHPDDKLDLYSVNNCDVSLLSHSDIFGESLSQSALRTLSKDRIESRCTDDGILLVVQRDDAYAFSLLKY